MKNMRNVMHYLVLAVFLAIVGGGCGGGTAGTFMVGGTVSGLVGTLVMQCNGADDLTVTADGSFTFATVLADKTDYSVTTLTQPASQTCTVNNGTGTLSEAHVTDVAVTCSVNTYTVNGTVTGLAGTMVLQNNDADDLTITDNGAFTFVTALADGSDYEVAVSSRPIVQNCAVTNDTGTLSGADVTDVAVDCGNKAWAHPTDLTDSISPPGYDAEGVRVAMKGDVGNAVVVWYQVNGANNQIFMSEFRNGVWTNPVDETDHISPSGQTAEYPDVAMDESGNAIIVWNQSDGSHSQIFKSEYRGGTWTHPTGLSDYISPDTPVATNAYSPHVAMDDNGDAVIVWNQWDGLSFQIFRSEYRGGSWTHPANINDNLGFGNHNARLPDVAMDADGDAILIWKQSNGTETQIYKSEYRSGSWTHPADINDYISFSGHGCGYPYVAMDDNGQAIIAWDQDHTSGYALVFKSEYRGGSWTHPATIDDYMSPAGDNCSMQDIAMDPNGDAIIVWDQSDGAGTGQTFMSEFR